MDAFSKQWTVILFLEERSPLRMMLKFQKS